MRPQSLERIFSLENMGNLFKLGRTPSEDEFHKFLADNGLDQQEGAEELRDLPRVASIDLLRAYFTDNLSPQHQHHQQQKQQPVQQPQSQEQQQQPQPVQPQQPKQEGNATITAPASAPAPTTNAIKAETNVPKVAAEPVPTWKEQKPNVKITENEPKSQANGNANPTPPPSSCGSDDDEDDLELKALKLKETDPDKQMNKEELRRLRRMISNRESARRSRRRKLEHVNCLDNQISQLKNENSALLERLAGMEQRCRDAMMDNSMLREEVDALQLQLRNVSGGKMHRSSSLQRIASQEHLAKRGRGVPGDFSGHHYFQNPSPPCRQQFDPNLGMMFRSMNSFENMMQLQYPAGGTAVPGN